jgi:hypothetical protein
VLNVEAVNKATIEKKRWNHSDNNAEGFELLLPRRRLVSRSNYEKTETTSENSRIS